MWIQIEEKRINMDHVDQYRIVKLHDVYRLYFYYVSDDSDYIQFVKKEEAERVISQIDNFLAANNPFGVISGTIHSLNALSLFNF